MKGDTMKDMDRLTIEIEPEMKRTFREKVKTEGFSIRGIISKWIGEYLAEKK